MGFSQCRNNYHWRQAKKVHLVLWRELTLLGRACFHCARVRNSIDSPACSKQWSSAKWWDKWTHYDIDLNKLSSRSLWQQTSARLYGGRSQRTDTNYLLATFWCHCRCQPRDAKRFWNLIGVSLATSRLMPGFFGDTGYITRWLIMPIEGIVRTRALTITCMTTLTLSTAFTLALSLMRHCEVSTSSLKVHQCRAVQPSCMR